MDLRRLEVFYKLMETRSFSKTAQELNLTQPTVSGHIKTLEEQIGLTLFDRHKRLVRPTGAAQVLLEYARSILELHREAVFALEKHRGRISGDLVLGGSTIPGAYILPSVIGRFHRIYEETRMKLIIDDTIGIIERVASGDIELGIVGAVHERDYLDYEALVEDRMVLAVPTNHPLTRPGRPVEVKDLSETPFIIREDGSGTKTSMLKALAHWDLMEKELNVVAEMGSTEAVRQAIKAGLGVSILSRVAVEDVERSGLVKIIPVEGLDLSRQFYLVTSRRKSRSPVGAAFLEFLHLDGRPPAKLNGDHA